VDGVSAEGHAAFVRMLHEIIRVKTFKHVFVRK
jgi:hypothetical protein